MTTKGTGKSPSNNGGQIPKRSEQRRRRNKPDEDAQVDKPAKTGSSEKPPAHTSWHPIAQRWYDSLERSGESVYFEPSDWAAAEVTAESLSRDLYREGKPIPGMNLAAYQRTMTVLLMTEGDRRRLRMELQRGDVVDEDDAAAEATVVDIHSRFSG